MELVGDNEEFCHVSLQQAGVMATSKAINYFLHQPEITDYNMLWASNHGFGRFVVQKPSTKTARCTQKLRQDPIKCKEEAVEEKLEVRPSRH